MDRLDFKALVAAFKTICDDYDIVAEDPKSETKSLSFCNKMIFQIGPRAHTLRHSPQKHLFTLDFGDQSGVFISTDLSDDAENRIRIRNGGKQLILTPLQGSLLAVGGFYRMIEFVAKNHSNPNMNKYITPLAANVFCTDDLLPIAKILDVEQHIALMILNESCLSRGYFLKHSDVNVAVVAAIESTKLSDAAIQSKVVMKCLAEYARRGKKIHIATVSRLSQYAVGGIPYDMRPNILLASYNKAHYNIDPPSTILEQELLKRMISQYENGNKSYERLVAIVNISQEVPLIGNDNPPAPDDIESLLLGVGSVRLADAK